MSLRPLPPFASPARRALAALHPDQARDAGLEPWDLRAEIAKMDLPPGYDLGRARAVYVNGFLRIDVPAAQQMPQKTTKVPITEGV
mgnify:CR=1 FL=1